jgi:hypothetical protein
LEEGVTAYREALKECTRDREPLQWAMIEENLGVALKELGEREGGTERLEEALHSVGSVRAAYVTAGVLQHDSRLEMKIQVLKQLIAQRLPNSDGKSA